jgi:retron-type reverse transcriptase
MRNDIVFQHVITQTACDREDAQHSAFEEEAASLFDSSDFQWIIHAVIVRESDSLTLVAQDNA